MATVEGFARLPRAEVRDTLAQEVTLLQRSGAT